ncbi:YfhD family protein [Tuberibacillus calidus]|mgnify:CR=1 FL=1|jgi:hypothetical protein|uniref:YfhD family protein n=1 Tax=Tuberibacillus calidus TaxID=340097 RepID=UPI0003FD5551|nr:YfhD family protein [Tuberibacillus calidus]
MSAKKRKKNNNEDQDLPIARAQDIRYSLPLDEDDWEARARMEAADHRAQKK